LPRVSYALVKVVNPQQQNRSRAFAVKRRLGLQYVLPRILQAPVQSDQRNAVQHRTHAILHM